MRLLQEGGEAGGCRVAVRPGGLRGTDGPVDGGSYDLPRHLVAVGGYVLRCGSFSCGTWWRLRRTAAGAPPLLRTATRSAFGLFSTPSACALRKVIRSAPEIPRDHEGMGWGA